jgi:hypothetical protein
MVRLLQADAYAGLKLAVRDRLQSGADPGGRLAHARRPFFALADIAVSARRTAEGKSAPIILPLALEAVRGIDALFEFERSINGRSAEERRAIRQ